MHNYGLVKKVCIDNIKEQADKDFKFIVEGHYPVIKRKGVQHVVDCPGCGKKDGLQFNFSKGFFRCFKCEEITGNGAIAWCVTAEKMEFLDAIKFLAEKTNINIEYEGNTLSKVKKTVKAAIASFKNFVTIMLEKSGLTEDDIISKVIIDNQTTIALKRYTTGSKKGFNIIDGDDAILHYVTLYRKLDQDYPKKDKNGLISGKPYDFSRVRYQRPEDHCDKKGKPIKYASPPNSGLHIWHPEPLIRKFETKAPIPVLHIQEGEKKADKCTKHGIISCGIMGINYLVDDKTGLHPDFGLIITQCKTQSVVFTVDSDWQDLKATDPHQRIDDRAKTFLSAVRKFQAYFLGFTNQNIHLKIYFAYVKDNENNDKGTDDLLANTLKGKEGELLKDYEFAMASGDGKGKYVDCIDITGFSEYKLKELFHLENKDSFIHFHYELLKDRPEFNFAGTKWKFDNDGQIVLAQEMDPNHEFCVARFGKSSSEERYEFKADKWLRWCNERMLIGRLTINKDSRDHAIIQASPNTKTIRVIREYEAIDTMLDYLYGIEEIGIFNFLFNSDKYLVPKKIQKLWFLDNTVKLLKNDKSTGYMYFSHGFWKVTNNEITHLEINDSPGYVWEEKVKDAQPKLDTEPLFRIEKSIENSYSILFREDWQECHFLKYLFNTCLYCGKDGTPTEQELEEAYKSLMTKITAFGYLMHHYYDPAVTKMVVAMDGKERELGDAHGRSGKSLFFKGLEQIVTMVTIDGRQPDLVSNKNIFAKVNERTALAYLDDIAKDVDMQAFYVKISGEGFDVRAMYQDTRTIAKEYKPKMAASTNFGLRGILDSGSSLDRLVFVVFSDYYNAKHKPTTDFGVNFFDQWEGKQWTFFYNFAAWCLKTYLKFGILDFHNKRQEKVHLATDIGPTFMDWANEYIRDEGRWGIEIDRKELQEDFKKHNPRLSYTAQVFRKKCTAYAKFHERILFKKKSNSVEYFNFGGEMTIIDRPKEATDQTLNSFPSLDNEITDIESEDTPF